MNETVLRTALIGAAGKVAAPCHLNALRMAERVQLVALCDTDRQTLDERAREHGVDKTFDDFRSLLDDPEIDALDVVVPPHLHAEITIAGLQAGKHVYVEKPMARDLGEARAMIDAAERASVQLMVGESYFFHSPHRLARKLVDDGTIGSVLQIRVTLGPWLFNEAESRRLGGMGHDPAWRVDPALSGGGSFPWMMDHGPHLFATARLFGGSNIKRVSALPRTHGFGRESHLGGITGVSWVYENDDVDGHWTYADTAAEAVRWVGFRTEVVGTEGTLLVFGEGGGPAPGFPPAAPVTLFRDGKETDYAIDEGPDRSWISNNSYYDRAHTNTLEHFAGAILDGSDLLYDGRDGMRDLSATLATIKSAIEEVPVSVADVDDRWRAYTRSADA